MTEQNERAFQKQSGVFLNSKSLLSAKTKKGVRYYKNVGLGIKTPKEAIEGTYVDKKCPFTSDVNISYLHIRWNILIQIFRLKKLARKIFQTFFKKIAIYSKIFEKSVSDFFPLLF